MYVSIIDTETTGTDRNVDRVIEASCILFSLEHFTPVESYSSLIRAAGQPEESEKVNHIPSAALPTAPDPEEVWGRVRALVSRSKAILAHHAEFDRDFCPEEFRSLKWICTQDDIDWPMATRSKSLVQIALSHGLGVATAHRAHDDCDLISRLLQRCHAMGFDVRAMLRRGLRPKAKFRADVPRDQNDILKEHGFRWDPLKKMWWRQMAIEDAEKLAFKVKRIVEPAETGTGTAGPLFDDLPFTSSHGSVQ